MCCGQMVGWIKMKLGIDVGVGPDHIALDGDPAPSKKGTQQPANFWPMYCGQTVRWIKMSLSMEVGLGPGHIVWTQLPFTMC